MITAVFNQRTQAALRFMRSTLYAFRQPDQNYG
jgi:hypothetical protein